MTNEEAINRLRLDIDMAQFDPITGNRRCLFGDEKELVEAQRLGMEALRAQKVRKWKAINFHVVFCSECRFEIDIMQIPNNLMSHLKYCPNCGARMEGQE